MAARGVTGGDDLDSIVLGFDNHRQINVELASTSTKAFTASGFLSELGCACTQSWVERTDFE